MKINPKQLERAMKQMGMQMVNIEAEEVVIKAKDKDIVISNPQVSKVNMMGQETFQIVGEPEEKPISSEPEINQDDINTVIEQTGVTEDKAKEAIAQNQGDLAKAIIALKGEQ